MFPLKKDFFKRRADIVAQELLGKILVRKLDGKTYRARIVETEAYFGKNDPASRAFKGKNKVSEVMWSSPGTLMIYNVHKYWMLNFVTGKKGEPNGVLIRALEPLNFNERTNGPGLLTLGLKIDKSFNGISVIDNPNLKLITNNNNHEIGRSNRIGVTKDLIKPLRFFIKNNIWVSRKIKN